MPFHQLETYLRKLTLKGFRVAVCEQLMEASAVKGLVPRAVTRVITPGTLVDESLLETDQRVAVAEQLIARYRHHQRIGAQFQPLAPVPLLMGNGHHARRRRQRPGAA